MRNHSDLNGSKGIRPSEDVLVRASGFVLAGGQSSRMGQDKAMLTLGGRTLIERSVRKLGMVCADVAIAGGTDGLERFGRVVRDKNPGCGPLGGIVAALEQSLSEWNLFVPVDAPFVPVSGLKALLLGAADFRGVCVMASARGQKQPLCAVYSRAALPVLREELSGGRWKVTQAIAKAGVVKYLDFDCEDWFRNLNTPEDFAEAEQHVDALDM